MERLLRNILAIAILIFVFIILPILAIQLFIYLAPVILIGYILYKIFAPKKPPTQTYHNENVMDAEFTVHDVDDEEK